MLIVGERINGTRQGIARAIGDRKCGIIRREAVLQKTAGADLVDLNAGTGQGDEADNLRWLIGVVREAGCDDLCLDSSSPAVLAACLPMVKGRVMLNSVSGEQKKLAAFLGLADGFRGDIVGLTMDDRGIPGKADERLTIGERIVSALTGRGVKPEQIYLDTLVQPVATSPGNGRVVLDAIRAVKKELPGVRTICGLSNVSFGLPGRRILNRCFLSLAIEAGLDAAIVDPTDPGITAVIRAAEGLLGRDEFCLGFLAAFRRGELTA